MPHISVSYCHFVVSFVTIDNDWYLTTVWLDLRCTREGCAGMNCDIYRRSCHLNFLWTADGVIRTTLRNWTQHCGLLVADPSSNATGERVKHRQYTDWVHSNCTNFRANRNVDYTNYKRQHNYDLLFVKATRFDPRGSKRVALTNTQLKCVDGYNLWHNGMST